MKTVTPVSSWSENFPPAPTWTSKDIPDLGGKVFVVTGGYGGIGYETTRALLVHGAKVYILGRSQSKFESCVTRLSSIQSNRPHFIPCDLASILSTKTAAEKVLSLEPIIHVLFCSAGLAWFPYSSKSGDGYELTWHTNVMGHFILSQLLMDALEKGFEETGKKGRVVWTSSYGLNTAPKGGVALESLKADDKGMVGAGFNRQALYGQSKLAMVVVSNEIERRHGDKILTIALNPGNIRTDLTRAIHSEGWRIASWLVAAFEWCICYDAELGAVTQLYAARPPMWRV